MANITFISKEKLRALNPVFCDVRRKEDYETADHTNRVSGSVFLDFDSDTLSINDDNASLPSNKDKAIVTFCYKGNRAQKAAEMLCSMGYTNVLNGKNVAHIRAAMCENNNVEIRQLFETESSTYSYILMDKSTKEAVLIDPVIETVERDIAVLRNLGAKLLYVLNTHVHTDHITGSGRLKDTLNVGENANLQSVISKASSAHADILVENGDTIVFGAQVLTVRNTPGHTPGCVTYVLNNQTHAFCGDTVLIGGCGRTDFQGGDPAVLYDSVMENIFTLPNNTVLYPAHDYKGRTCTTVGEEKAFNERLTKSKEDFIELMLQRFDGTNYPKKLDVSLPANMKCGVY